MSRKAIVKLIVADDKGKNVHKLCTTFENTDDAVLFYQQIVHPIRFRKKFLNKNAKVFDVETGKTYKGLVIQYYPPQRIVLQQETGPNKHFDLKHGRFQFIPTE